MVVLTSLVLLPVQIPADLEAALREVQYITEEAPQGSKLGERALKHALLLSDVDQMYNVALGMYDFQLVRGTTHAATCSV